MTRGDKDKYTDKQKREAADIAEGYEERGVSEKEAEKRAWSTVNKMYGGGAKNGSGTKKIKEPSSPIKGGTKVGKVQPKRPSTTAHSVSAKKAAETRKEKKEEKSWFARLFS